jgi:hypothetical protein
MFEEFSAGYYLGRLYVEPHDHDHDHAVIHETDHERMNRRLYATGEGVERLDTPLVMKLDGAHFPVHGEKGIPSGTLGLPPSVAGDDRGLPERREVFLAKPDRAADLLRYAGHDPVGSAV